MLTKRMKNSLMIASVIPWLFSIPVSADQIFPDRADFFASDASSFFSQGHYMDVQPSQQGSITVTSPLLKGMRVPKLKVQRCYKDYQVSSTELYNDKGRAVGSLILVKRNDGSFIALVDTPCHQGTIIGKCDGTQTFLEITRKPDFYKTDYIISPKQIAEAKAAAEKHNPKIDALGRYHVTVFAGLSQGVVSLVGNPTAYALAEVETVNLGLRNSHVNNVVLDLAEVGITPTERPITVQTLNNLPVIFPGSLSRADLVSGFFLGIRGQDTAVGWGVLGGRLSVNWAHSPTVFRHEVGHNAGGDHCNTGQNNFRFGYQVDNQTTTILCGNSLSFFSTPHVTDSFGRPLGNARTADMARQWREFAPIMSTWSGIGPIPPVSPSFHLENRMVRGRCLDVLAGNPQTVGVSTCATNANQRWVTDETGHIRWDAHKHLCLGGTGNLGFVTLQNCTSTDPRILWRVSNENYINRANNQLLNPLDGAANNARVNLSPATGSDFQRWIVSSVTPPPPVNYPFMLSTFGRCMTASTGAPRNIVTNQCTSNNVNQIWVMDNTGRIRLNSNQSLCLNRTGGANGDASLQSCDTTSQDILWRESNNNSYINVANNQCLNAVTGAAGGRVNTAVCNNAILQQWNRIIPF